MSPVLPPAQPAYILRGHSAQIHSLCFLCENTRLLTGDANGWAVLWNLTSKRAAVVWRPHRLSILGIGLWGEDAIITHGRDGYIHVWQIRPEDEKNLSQELPITSSEGERPNPWLLHSIQINTINFCSFASTPDHGALDQVHEDETVLTQPSKKQAILIAATGRKDEEIEIYGLPSERKMSTVPPPKVKTVGMVMAVKLLHQSGNLLCISGYESGLTSIQKHGQDDQAWTTIYLSRPHTQPILSLDICHSTATYFTSGADATIASHALPVIENDNERVESIPTDHETDPQKTFQTKHSGQQSLTVRSDGNIFATAGWDGRMRVYSTKTLKELAILKWHQEGCYAVAFADLNYQVVASNASSGQSMPLHGDIKRNQASAAIAPLGQKQTMMTVQQQRENKVKQTHWLAAGSKDGKVSLWDIY